MTRPSKKLSFHRRCNQRWNEVYGYILEVIWSLNLLQNKFCPVWWIKIYIICLETFQLSTKLVIHRRTCPPQNLSTNILREKNVHSDICPRLCSQCIHDYNLGFTLTERTRITRITSSTLWNPKSLESPKWHCMEISKIWV